MAVPTIQVAWSALRQKISSNFDDLITFTCASGSTTQCTVPARTHQLLATAGTLVGAEASCISGTGSAQTTSITAHTVASDTVTLTFRTLGTGLSSDSVLELHNINGDGYTKSQYDNAIYAAIDTAADTTFTDLSKAVFAIGTSLPNNNPVISYPMPSGFSKMWEVNVLAYPPLTRSPIAALTTWQNFMDTTTNMTRLGQSFQLGNSYNLVSYVAVYMYAVGSPTGNLTAVVETNSGSTPSGTAVQNGTASATVAASTVPTHPGYVVFTFDPPVLLEDATTYWFYIKSSGSTSATNYFTAGVAGDGNYSPGNRATYIPSAWTAVAGSDLIFAISGEGNWWRKLKKIDWRYQGGSTDQILISNANNYYEGSPIQIVGGAAIARPTAETDIIQVRPDYVETYAMVMLKGERAGVPSGVNSAQGAQVNMSRMPLIPPPRRALPPNTVDVI